MNLSFAVLKKFKFIKHKILLIHNTIRIVK